MVGVVKVVVVVVIIAVAMSFLRASTMLGMRDMGKTWVARLMGSVDMKRR